MVRMDVSFCVFGNVLTLVRRGLYRGHCNEQRSDNEEHTTKGAQSSKGTMFPGRSAA
jgi:hypothetical protein